jgi:hypothetical protein
MAGAQWANPSYIAAAVPMVVVRVEATASLPASRAGLPGLNAWVKIVPPLPTSTARFGSAEFMTVPLKPVAEHIGLPTPLVMLVPPLIVLPTNSLGEVAPTPEDRIF